MSLSLVRRVPWIAALVVLAACAPAPPPAQPAAPAGPDPAALRAGVDAGNAALMAGITAKDAGAISMTYTEKGSLLPPGGARVDGREAIGAFWGNLLAAGPAGARLETVALEVQGETGIEEGRYTLAGADGATVVVGKYVVIWKNEAGVWRLHRDIWNSDGPVAPPAQ